MNRRKFLAATVGGSLVAAAYGQEEQGRGKDEPGTRLPGLGERLEFLVPHCDPTTNLYERLYAMRQGRVEAVWPLVARRG